MSLALCEEEKKCRYLSEQVAILFHLIDAVKGSSRRDNPLVHSVENVNSLQLSSAASRDSTEDEMRGGSRNLNSLLEEQAGIKSSMASTSVIVVASFDRTTRSASNASILSSEQVVACSRQESSESIACDSIVGSQLSSSASIDEPSFSAHSKLSIPLSHQVSSSSVLGPDSGPISPYDTNLRPCVGRGHSSNDIQLPVQDTSSRHRGSESSAHGWGLHLMIVALKNSSLANELRLLYNSLVSGSCVSLSFNSISGSSALYHPIPLYCFDTKLCDDVRKYCSTSSNHVCGLSGDQKNHSSLRLSMSQTSLTQQLISGSGAVRPRSSFSVVGGGSGSLLLGSGVGELARRHGINLETDSLLPLADSGVILSLVKELLGHSGDRGHTYGENNCRLFAFVEALDPTLTVLELSLTLNEPIEEVRLTPFISILFISVCSC